MMKLALAALAAALPHAATAENSECSITNTPSCPSGKVLILGEGCMSDCDDGAAGVQNDCDDFCDAGRCCQTPHVLTGTELTADATANGVAAALTNTGYEVTWERYSDATCTTAKAEFVGGLPISGRSATCIAQVNDPDNDPTNFGWYGYCPGETGKGYVEYIVTMGEGQASPTPSASCPSGGATGKGTWEGPYEVNTCVCYEREDDGTCDEWIKLTCTPAPQIKSSGAVRAAIGGAAALLLLLPSV